MGALNNHFNISKTRKSIFWSASTFAETARLIYRLTLETTQKLFRLFFTFRLFSGEFLPFIVGSAGHVLASSTVSTFTTKSSSTLHSLFFGVKHVSHVFSLF